MRYLRTIACAGAAFALPAGAHAATLVQTQAQTVAGQAFTFAFAGAPAATGPGSLTFRIRGDFTLGASLGESFDFDLEGIFAEAGIQATNANLISSFDSNDNLFEVIFGLTQAQLVALTADGTINLSVNFASGVDPELSADPFITATIDYASAQTAVPEPSTWALMIAGFGLVGAAMRRRPTVRVALA